MGLNEYLVIYGTARITEGGAAELLQRLARTYLGPDVRFPPMDSPPPGYITYIRVDRVSGVGPRAAQRCPLRRRSTAGGPLIPPCSGSRPGFSERPGPSFPARYCHPLDRSEAAPGLASALSAGRKVGTRCGRTPTL